MNKSILRKYKTQNATDVIKQHMNLFYSVNLEDLEISDTPGYWRDKAARNHPGHPLHGCLGCSGPFKATYVYFDPPHSADGKFSSRTKTWKELYIRNQNKEKT